METVKKSAIFAFLLLFGCSSADRQTGDGLYTSDGSDQIIALNGSKYYFGTKDVPHTSSVLTYYGTPIRKAKHNISNCVSLGNLTFAYSATSSRFSCEGYLFVSRLTSNAVEVIMACSSQDGRSCSQGNNGKPNLNYQYGYIPKKGVEWVSFLSDEMTIEETLHHRYGMRILGD